MTQKPRIHWHTTQQQPDGAYHHWCWRCWRFSTTCGTGCCHVCGDLLVAEEVETVELDNAE